MGAVNLDALDNAAAAALYMLQLEKDPTREHIGALYAKDGGVARTDTVTTGGRSSVSGSLSVPRGSLGGLFHNHPLRRLNSGMRDVVARDFSGEDFSPEDKAMAKRAGVPSYISTPTGAWKRYDPSSDKTENVVAEFPMNDFRGYLMKQLLNRTPEDPRGLLLEKPEDRSRRLLVSELGQEGSL